MEILDQIIHWTGFAVCHQLPSRTFEIDGHSMALCARCTGTYLGVATTYIYLFSRRRWDINAIPRLWQCIVLILFIAPMAFDGVTSYGGLRETTNVIRLITGMLTGMVLPVFAFPLLSKEILIIDVKGIERRDVFRKWYDLVIWFAIAGGLLALGLWRPDFLFYPLSIITTLALWGILFNLALVIVEMVGEGLKVLKRPWTFIIAAMIVVIAIAFMSVIHWFALQQLLKMTGGVLPE